jgi:hypothetical protein
LLRESEKGVAFVCGEEFAREVSGIKDGALIEVDAPRKGSRVEEAEVEPDIVPCDG